MIDIEKRKFPRNAKTTKINCLRCDGMFVSHRNHTKYCSSLCRVQDGKERKDKGYVEFVFRGNEQELYNFFRNLSSDIAGIKFKEDLEKVEQQIISKEHSKNWKHEFPGFRLSFFPFNKSYNYEMYFTNEKNDRKAFLDRLLEMKNIMRKVKV